MNLLTRGLMLTAQAAEEMPPGSIIHFDKSMLIQLGIQWINVMLLTAVLIYVLYKPVKKFMAARTERIKKEIDAVDSERNEVESLKAEYKKLLADIELEREEIFRQTHKKAVEKSDQFLFEARREVEALYSRGLAELEVERQNIISELKQQMVEISMMAASRFVEVSIDRETQDRYIDEAFNDWEGL